MQTVFQKLELINDIPVELLDDPLQRELYKQKLRSEIQNFRQREALYVTKRRELQQLELSMRKNQGEQTSVREAQQQDSETSQTVLKTLKA